MTTGKINKDMAVAAALPLVTGLAAVWMAFDAANLTWIILDDSPLHQSIGEVAEVSRQSDSLLTSSLNDITQYHLFGQDSGKTGAVAAPKMEAINAPETTLNLTLRGLFTAENDAFALIASGKGDEQVYKVGMMVNSSAKIDAIHVNSVVLSRGGKLEVLYLEDVAEISKKGKTSPRKSDRSTQAQRSTGSSKLGAQRERLIKNPQEAMRFARIQPVMRQGKLSGYRINPGSDPQLFNELGFKSGDLVKEINGVAVDDPTKIGSLMTQLTTAKQLSVTIERGGQTENLLIGF